jgi:hypothetical protein
MSGDCSFQRCTPEKSLRECSSMSGDFCSGDVHMSGDCLFRRCTLEKSLQGCSSMSGDFCSRDVRRLFVSQMYSGPWRNHSRGVPACPEVFAPEMYTSPEIFASEMYSREITPGVFQHVQRFLLGDTCPEFLLQRNHSGSVPTCLESFSSEMYSVEITPGVFSMSGDVSSGDPHMSEDFCIGDEITPGVFLHIWRFLLQRYMSRDFFSGDVLQRITLGVFSISGEFCSGDVHMSKDFCFRDVFRRNHSRSAPAHLKVVGPEMHVQRFLLRRCTPEKSLRKCSSMSRDFCSGDEHMSGDCLFRRCTLEKSLQGCSSMSGGFCSGDTFPEFLLQRNHSESIPTCLESFSLEMYSGEITPGVFQHFWRFLLRGLESGHIFQQRNYSKLNHSGDTYSRGSQIGRDPIFFQCLWGQLHICLEMGTSPELFTPNLYFA